MKTKKIFKKLQIVNSGPALELNDINAFEEKYEVKFPEGYIDFLMKFNGGKPIPNCLEIVEKGKTSFVAVRAFLQISEDKNYSLEKFFQEFKIEEKRLPSLLIPIGIDSFGNLFCISVNSENWGWVFFWDHEGEMWKSDNKEGQLPNNVYFVAKNIESMLTRMFDLQVF